MEPNRANPYRSSSPELDSETPRSYRDSEDEFLDNNIAVRSLGALILLVGLWIAHPTIWIPIEQATSGIDVTLLETSGEGVILSLALISCGTIMLFLGRHTRRILYHRWYDASPTNILGTTVLIVSILLVAIQFQTILQFAASNTN